MSSFDEFLGRVPIARPLGVRPARATEGEAALTMPVRQDLLQFEDRVHGGVLATLVDTLTDSIEDPLPRACAPRVRAKRSTRENAKTPSRSEIRPLHALFLFRP